MRPRKSTGSSVTPLKFLSLFLVVFIVFIYFNFPYERIQTINSEKMVENVGLPALRIRDTKDSENPAKVEPKDGRDPLEALYGAPKQKPRVAYAITVTKDGPFVDGALVLGYAAKKFHDFSKGYNSGYSADLVAFVVPSVKTSRPILEKFGWRIIERGLPVQLDEIENREYAEKMRDSGCCGADEFLKLWAYTLTEYHRVIHLDMDSIIFKNMDEILNVDREMLYTGDYNMKAGSPVAPAQGGFLVITPSMETFEEYRKIIKKGDYGNKGWGGTRIGNFWGGQTIQGIVPYFYHSIRPGGAMELNRCIYNCMVDNPYNMRNMKCLDGHETCEDCRLQDPDKVSSAHFTICQKPWTCTAFQNPRNKVLCSAFHKKWFQLRDEFEKDEGMDLSYRVIDTRNVGSLGMCKGWGDNKYLPIPIHTSKHA